MKVTRGDSVRVLSGKDRGKSGKVARVFPKTGRLLVEGVNVKKKHRRSRRQDRKGEIVLLPAPIAASAVLLLCPSCGQPTRVRYGRTAAGEKVRECRKCGKAL